MLTLIFSYKLAFGSFREKGFTNDLNTLVQYNVMESGLNDLDILTGQVVSFGWMKTQLELFDVEHSGGR